MSILERLSRVSSEHKFSIIPDDNLMHPWIIQLGIYKFYAMDLTDQVLEDAYFCLVSHIKADQLIKDR